MTDLKIDPLTNDISLAQGRVVTTEGDDAKGQRIRTRLLTVRGEWFLDTSFGVDYYGIVWVKDTPQAVLAAHIQDEILKEADEGDEITSFEMDYDGTTRTLSVQATLETSDGETINVTV